MLTGDCTLYRFWSPLVRRQPGLPHLSFRYQNQPQVIVLTDDTSEVRFSVQYLLELAANATLSALLNLTWYTIHEKLDSRFGAHTRGRRGLLENAKP